MFYKYFYAFLILHIIFAIFNFCFLFFTYKKINEFLYHLNFGISFSRICSNTINELDDFERDQKQINLKKRMNIYSSAFYKYHLYIGEIEQYKNIILKIRNLNCPIEEFEKFQFELYYLSGKIRFRRQQLWKLFFPTNFVFNLINILLASTFQTEKLFFAESIIEKTKFITAIINFIFIIYAVLKLISVSN